MRKTVLALTLLPVLQNVLLTPLSARELWVVRGPVEPRISQEIDELGREHRARIQFVPEGVVPAGPRGALVFELKTAKDLDEFLELLNQQAPGEKATRNLAREGYTIELSYSSRSKPAYLRITAAGPAGFHYALLRLPAILRAKPSELENRLIPAPQGLKFDPAGKTVRIADFPSFPERGIVEGFYGAPWSHEDRLDILRFEGQHGMNVYYYAPKDDPYHRKLWREPYPPEQTKRLKDLVDSAHAQFVDFCFAISPGLSMVYSSEGDFSALKAKLASVGRLGVSCFALFLDDVPPELQAPADRARYKDLGAAHVDLINRLYTHLKTLSPTNRLVVTPTTYTDEWGSRDYVRELGAGVHPDIPIVWTGPRVVSPSITVADADQWGALLERQPLVWDNFPVNDGIPWRLNLGPVRGRDPKLPEAIRGLISNPMNQAQASQIPLQTVAEYLWNPRTYQPEAALERAVFDQYGPSGARRLSAFLSTYGDYWWDENIFQPLFTERRGTFQLSPIERRIQRLTREQQSLRSTSRFRKLARELQPFPSQARTRLGEVIRDPAFRRLRGNKLEWREDYDVLSASRLSETPRLDGDFSKWETACVSNLDQAEQISTGRRLWRGPEQFSARFALGWDRDYLYLGVDVVDSTLYQPFTGRDIPKGDVVSVLLETAFRKHFQSTRNDGDEYHLYFSPGDFARVAPSIYSDEEYLPPRPVPRNYNQDIKTVWRKTAKGFSADIRIPATWFEGGAFKEGYEIGLSVSPRKAFPLATGAPEDADNVPQITFHSKRDPLFPARFGNPSSYERLVLRAAGGCR